MQPEQSPIGRYLSLSNSITLSPHYAHYSVFTGEPLQHKNISKELYFEMLIKPSQSIRLMEQNNKSVATLSMGDLQVVVRAVKDPHQFDFERGVYRNYLVASLIHKQGLQQELGRKLIELGVWTRLLLTIEKTVQFDQENKWVLEDCVPVLEVGHHQQGKCFNCKIKQVSLSDVASEVKQQQQIASTQGLEDGPLDSIPKNQIPSPNDLPQYEAPRPVRNRLYLCHDMEGGYRQDTNKHHPYPSLKDRYSLDQKYAHTYRAQHLVQAQIFNYFSHHLVSVPPLHWRRLCRAAGTLCLGTFIVEKEIPHENEYLSEQTVRLLIYLCRKYQFDGYLINLEHPVKNVDKLLLPWLSKLTREIHEAVPGSQIIWYDSIVKMGKVAYQNQLNEHNRMFYQVCDGMFLNYWWNQQKLANSIKFWEKGKSIYVGSDCFGRGTFGGGGYFTHRAISAIRQVDSAGEHLAPALFAMGYTYEKDKNNSQLWKINQKCMYRGMRVQKFQMPHSLWSYARPNINGHTWLMEGQWIVTSFQPCKRKYSSSLKELVTVWDSFQGFIISFFTTVKGTGPKFEDPYKVTLKVSLAQVVMHQTTTGDRVASEQEQQVELKLYIEKDLVKPETVVTVIQQGHDVQKWGGHHGSRFKNDYICFIKYAREQDWVAKVKTNFPNGVALPCLAYYNLGHGRSFYLRGRQMVGNYDFMSDTEVNYAYLMNPPMHVNINYKDAYTGGTSLLVQGLAKLKLVQVDLSTMKSNALKCRVVVKTLGNQTPYILSYKLKAEQKQAAKPVVVKALNSWQVLTFDLEVAEKPPNEKLILYLETKTQDCSYLLGETAVHEVKEPTVLPQIKSLSIDLSDNNPPVQPLFFNVRITMTMACRVLLQFGEGFACFGHADQLNSNQIVIKGIHNRTPAGSANSLIVYRYTGEQEFMEIHSCKIDMKKLATSQMLKLI